MNGGATANSERAPSANSSSSSSTESNIESNIPGRRKAVPKSRLAPNRRVDFQIPRKWTTDSDGKFGSVGLLHASIS